jgi:hypothetical protein
MTPTEEAHDKIAMDALSETNRDPYVSVYKIVRKILSDQQMEMEKCKQERDAAVATVEKWCKDPSMRRYISYPEMDEVLRELAIVKEALSFQRRETESANRASKDMSKMMSEALRENLKLKEQLESVYHHS